MKSGEKPLKILHVVNSLYSGGAEKLLVDAVLKYTQKGLGSDVLVLNARKSHLYDTLANEPGIRMIHSSETKSVYSFSHIFTLRKLLPLYDIVHVHLFPSLYWTAIANLFTPKSKTPIILTEHSTNNKRRGNWFYKRVDRFLYKQFNKIVAISDIAEKSLREHLGAKFKNIITINNGINLEIIDRANAYPKETFGLKEDDFLLIQVSGFRYPKDQKTVIKALSKLPENVHLLLVGDGIELEACRDFAKEQSLDRRVQFLGLRSDVPELLKTADVAILSSIYEGLSLASVEGLASARPFIATDVPGLREVVKGAGLLFPTGDYEKLADLVLRLYTDNNYYKQTVESCLGRARQYDIENMVNNYIGLYQTAINHQK
ncbi:MAG: glycosyltransferase [Flavobacteriaceae bacterium]